MSIKTQYYSDISIKVVKLTATIQQAANLKQSLDYDINHNIKNFIIDLSECELFDSTFLGVLVVTLKKLRGIGGSLKIVKPLSVFQFLLENVGGLKIFDMYTSLEEALDGFGSNYIPNPKVSNNFVAAQKLY